MPVESIRGTDGGDGAARAAELLNNSGNTRVGFARPRSRRHSERAMRTHAERAERFTKDGFDPSREALDYFRWSVERAQQARAEAARARERYEQLPSSSRHCEYPRANRRGAEDDANAPLRAATDSRHRQAETSSWHLRAGCTLRRLHDTPMRNMRPGAWMLRSPFLNAHLVGHLATRALA